MGRSDILWPHMGTGGEAGDDADAGLGAETKLWRSSADDETSIRQFRLEDGAREYLVTTPRCSIGSHASNTFVIDEPTVSRFHCELEIDGPRLRVRDLGSRNGTRLDGVHVREAFVRSGSVLGLGAASLRVLPEESAVVLPLSSRESLGGLVGRSIAMRSLFALLERAAESDATVLFEGQTGTGKSKAARALHALSSRAGGPFLTVDCAAMPAELLESELFGHRKGAFTGAHEDRTGVFEAAHKGTVFLDEVSELPLTLQPKLLRVIEDREVRRLGTNHHRPVDVRVLAATNRDLRREVNVGGFRADLYYRLAVIRATMPALSERPEDIELIATKLLEGLGALPETISSLLTPKLLTQLERAAWGGNVRELRNHLERCLVFRDALPPVTGPALQPGAVDPNVPYPEARRRALDAFERDYVRALVEAHGGQVARAAQASELDRAYLYRLIRRHRAVR